MRRRNARDILKYIGKIDEASSEFPFDKEIDPKLDYKQLMQQIANNKNYKICEEKDEQNNIFMFKDTKEQMKYICYKTKLKDKNSNNQQNNTNGTNNTNTQDTYSDHWLIIKMDPKTPNKYFIYHSEGKTPDEIWPPVGGEILCSQHFTALNNFIRDIHPVKHVGYDLEDLLAIFEEEETKDNMAKIKEGLSKEHWDIITEKDNILVVTKDRKTQIVLCKEKVDGNTQWQYAIPDKNSDSNYEYYDRSRHKFLSADGKMKAEHPALTNFIRNTNFKQGIKDDIKKTAKETTQTAGELLGTMIAGPLGGYLGKKAANWASDKAGQLAGQAKNAIKNSFNKNKQQNQQSQSQT